MVTVQHSVQHKDEILIEGNILLFSLMFLKLIVLLSKINLPQILQSIESYDGDSNSDYFLLTVLDRLIVMYIALFKTNFYCI